uniref:Uncharacterized protein n=1 Tax=Glossina palpalis gambiensis TaxID=67801 RepID=A0A1B0BYT5_9MUSC
MMILREYSNRIRFLMLSERIPFPSRNVSIISDSKAKFRHAKQEDFKLTPEAIKKEWTGTTVVTRVNKVLRNQKSIVIKLQVAAVPCL